jgi:hypothetical protein
MKIHIIRDSEITDELYNEVFALLSNSKGILEFVSYQDYSVDISQETPSDSEFFEYCIEFRERIKIREDSNDIVVLLSNNPNKDNWFSSSDYDGNIYVVCTEWEHYLPNFDCVYPVTNEVISNIFHNLLFEDEVDVDDHVHEPPRGCINDMCGNNKSDIQLKMKTADICSDCLQMVHDRVLDKTIFKQITDIIESLRKSMRDVNLFRAGLTPSRLLIRKRVGGLFLVDENNMKVSLSPLDMAVYMFFISQVDGVRFVDFDLFKKEFKEIYGSYYKKINLADFNTTVLNFTDVGNSDYKSQLISKVNAKIIKVLGEYEALPFQILKDEKDEKYKIKLDRNLITYTD